MHQFDKLEMESFTEAKDSYNEQSLFVAISRMASAQLKLPYHVLMKCTVDIGKPNARGVDRRVQWGQGKYRHGCLFDYK